MERSRGIPKSSKDGVGYLEISPSRRQWFIMKVRLLTLGDI